MTWDGAWQRHPGQPGAGPCLFRPAGDRVGAVAPLEEPRRGLAPLGSFPPGLEKRYVTVLYTARAVRDDAPSWGDPGKQDTNAAPVTTMRADEDRSGRDPSQSRCPAKT